MRKFKIKGISWRSNNTFYVDVEPSEKMYLAYERKVCEYKKLNENYNDECEGHFLNIAYDIDEKYSEFNLSSYFSEYAWDDIKYECSESEKKAVIEFINKWKDKVPENPDAEIYGDDFEYTCAISDDIPWKESVVR